MYLTPRHAQRFPEPRTEPGCGLSPQHGFTMIEVMVTLVIILLGLLGVFGLQVKASNVELESYQRAQALALVREMAATLTDVRALTTPVSGVRPIDAFSLPDASISVGAYPQDSSADPCASWKTSSPSQAKTLVCQWGDLLRGSAAKEGTTEVGAMLGARGCLVRVEPPQLGATADVFVVVVWQGLTATNDPPPTALTGKDNCAKDVNFGTGLRRGIALRVLVPDLKKDT